MFGSQLKEWTVFEAIAWRGWRSGGFTQTLLPLVLVIHNEPWLPGDSAHAFEPRFWLANINCLRIVRANDSRLKSPACLRSIWRWRPGRLPSISNWWLMILTHARQTDFRHPHVLNICVNGRWLRFHTDNNRERRQD